MEAHTKRASRYSLWIGLIILSQLAACGGGGGGGGSSAAPPPPPVQTTPQMLIEAHRIPPIEAIGSDNQSVYLASQFELSRYNKITGARDVLTGNLIDAQLLPSCGEIGIVDHAKDLIKGFSLAEEVRKQGSVH